jgi:hypothetical protein
MARLSWFLVAIGILCSPAAWGQNNGSWLPAGKPLSTGQYLQSVGKRAFAVQQADGNLCTYPGTPGHRQGPAIWCSNVKAPGGHFFAMVHADGNLCTYHGTPQAGGTTWCTNKVMRSGGPFFLTVDNSGDLCVAYNVTERNGRASLTTPVPLWCALAVKIGDGERCFDVVNNGSHNVWVTVYAATGSAGSPLRIDSTSCLEPGQLGHVHFKSCNLANAVVRGELTANSHCRHPRLCDTEVQMKDLDHRSYWRSIRFRGDRNGCWWDWMPR